jgi:osmotically-inducible protein OsmY
MLMKTKPLSTVVTLARPFPDFTRASNRVKQDQTVLLKGYGKLKIHPIRLDDEQAMIRFHARLSEDSIYMRYFEYLKLEQRIEHERLVRICTNTSESYAIVMELTATALYPAANLNSAIPKGAAEVTVRDGWVTLQGELEWRHAKDAAENALHHVPGVKGVTNLMTIKPAATSINLEFDVKSAFARNALLGTGKIQIEAVDGKITFRGKVRNYAEFEEAERVAWAARGVVSVDNQLEVVWFWGED